MPYPKDTTSASIDKREREVVSVGSGCERECVCRHTSLRYNTVVWCAPVGSNSERDSGKVKGKGQGMARRGENIDTYVYTVLYAHSLCVTLLFSVFVLPQLAVLRAQKPFEDMTVSPTL